MYENNLNTNNKQKLQFQAMNPAQVQNSQVPMEAINPELLKENIQDTYVGNRVSETAEDPKGMLYTAGIAVPTWFAITQGMDVYAKKCRGNFEDTIQYKMGKFGDKISDFFTENKLAKSSFAQSIKNGFGSFKNFVRTKIIDKSKILKAMIYTPSKPELDMVKGQANGMWGMQLFDYPQQGEKFVEPLKHVEDLDCYGASKAEIERFKNILKNAATPELKTNALLEAECETILKNSRQTRIPADITRLLDEFKGLDLDDKLKRLKDMKAFEWGYKDFAEMEEVAKHIQDRMPRVLEATQNANKKMFARIYGSKSSAWGRFVNKIMGREVYACETGNKLAGELGNIDLSKNPELERVLNDTGLSGKIPKSVFGKAWAKYINLITEGATNRVAGGKIVAMMQAGYLADVIYKTIKTDGGASEKTKAFAERFTEMIAFFACMPLGLKLMHSIGGLQYAGMSKQEVEKYRQAVMDLNKRNMAGEFINNAAGYKTEVQKLKEMMRLTGDKKEKNIIIKLFKKIGRIVTVGLEQIRPRDTKVVTREGIGGKLKDLFRSPSHFKYGFKQMAGYPMRIVLGMFMILPFLNKIAVKCCHAIVGKPKKSILDEGKEQPQQPIAHQQTQIPPQLQQQNLQQGKLPVKPNTQQQTITVQTAKTTAAGQSPTNLLNKYRNQINKENLSKNPNEPVRTYIPSPVGVKITNPDEPIRTYVPAPNGVKITNQEDTSAVEAALRRADLAEQQVYQTLKMN